MKALFQGIGILLSLSAVSLVFVTLYGCVFVVLWMWFAVPAPDVAFQAIPTAILIVIAIDYLAKEGVNRLYKDGEDTWRRHFFEAFIRPATVLLLGFVIKQLT